MPDGEKEPDPLDAIRKEITDMKIDMAKMSTQINYIREEVKSVKNRLWWLVGLLITANTTMIVIALRI